MISPLPSSVEAVSVKRTILLFAAISMFIYDIELSKLFIAACELLWKSSLCNLNFAVYNWLFAFWIGYCSHTMLCLLLTIPQIPEQFQSRVLYMVAQILRPVHIHTYIYESFFMANDLKKKIVFHPVLKKQININKSSWKNNVIFVKFVKF